MKSFKCNSLLFVLTSISILFVFIFFSFATDNIYNVNSYDYVATNSIYQIEDANVRNIEEVDDSINDEIVNNNSTSSENINSNNINNSTNFDYNNYYNQIQQETVAPVKIDNVEENVKLVYGQILPYVNLYAENFVNEILNKQVFDDENLDKFLNGLNFEKTKSFANDLNNKSKNLGSFINIERTDTIYIDNAYETILILKYEKGYLTISLKHNDSLPYILFAMSNNIDISKYLLDSSNEPLYFVDYYITNGIHSSQRTSIRQFSNLLKYIIYVLIVILILYNLYKMFIKKYKIVKNQNSNVEHKKDNKLDDTTTTAIITAALNEYLNQNSSNNNIYIKTIKKTNWKKV